MSQLEYLIALVSIIVGLALTDLAQSLRELIRPGRKVRWHWLPLVWAANVFLILVQLWWASFEALQSEVFAEALPFLPFLLMFLLLYLASALALPDPEWETAQASTHPPTSSSPERSAVLDLKAFYFSAEHRRWFFGALVALPVLGQMITILLGLGSGNGAASPSSLAATVGINLAIAVLHAGLIVTKRWWPHAIVALGMLAGLTYSLAMAVGPLS